MSEPKSRLRWFQFSLRTLLVFVTLCAIPCSWLAVKMQQARRQREAVAAIQQAGGGVRGYWEIYFSNGKTLKCNPPPGPVWLRYALGRLLGVDYYGSAKFDHTQVTDGLLSYLTVFDQLQHVSLDDTAVTDVGIEHLKGLRELRVLSLRCTKVSDVALQHVKAMSQLEFLDLQGTFVTDQGIKELQQALANCEIKH